MSWLSERLCITGTLAMMEGLLEILAESLKVAFVEWLQDFFKGGQLKKYLMFEQQSEKFEHQDCPGTLS